MTASKTTFASALAETQDNHRKSDLSNLAHAHTMLTRHIVEAQALQAEIEALGAKIDGSDDPIPEGEVKRVYDRATKLGAR